MRAQIVAETRAELNQVGNPRKGGREGKRREGAVVLLVAFKEGGLLFAFLHRLAGEVRTHARAAVFFDQGVRFAKTEVGGDRGAHELLHGVENRAEGGGDLEALFHGGGRHHLGRHDAAVQNRDRDDRFFIPDQGHEGEARHGEREHREDRGRDGAPLGEKFAQVDGRPHAEDDEAGGPLAHFRETGDLDDVGRDDARHEADQEEKEAHEDRGELGFGRHAQHVADSEEKETDKEEKVRIFEHTNSAPKGWKSLFVDMAARPDMSMKSGRVERRARSSRTHKFHHSGAPENFG